MIWRIATGVAALGSGIAGIIAFIIGAESSTDLIQFALIFSLAYQLEER